MGASNNRRKAGKREPNRGSFVPGDPRINRAGRRPLSEEQRQFREELHDMRPAIIAAVKDLVNHRDATVVNKLIEKLAGKEAETLDVRIDDQRPDLSKLTTEQIREWKRLAALARGDGSGPGPGAGEP